MPIVMKSGTRGSRGFTLVEMSIVLVIIGLIIGGILKGQEIVASARQKAVINQVNAIRSAANTYLDRYRALPGDDPSAATVDATDLVNGNGDGVIGTPGLVTVATLATEDAHGAAAPASEDYMYFNSLISTNLISGGTLTPAATTSAATFGTGALPNAAVPGAGYTIVSGNYDASANGGTATVGYWIRLHKGTAVPAGAVSPRTMLAIDSQIDDGRSGKGTVRGTDATGAAATCDNAGVYAATTADDPLCVGFFQQ